MKNIGADIFSYDNEIEIKFITIIYYYEKK